ncbi:MAG: glycerate kinase [Victivallaceae bacterium]|nr:glycerate kinase [Victivallaceae bacterium]MDD4180882.1 glycerate kinase [Victivallaceae bacterium]
MKIIIATDSFKGALRSSEVCAAIMRGLCRALPDAELIAVPMADGGEGTVHAVIQATGGILRQAEVRDPLMKRVNAEYGLTPEPRCCAVFEMAAASGIELLLPNQLNPLKTTTFGTGQMLLKMLDDGAEEILLGIGGSATVDGGAGMMQALGAQLLDEFGNILPDGVGGGDLCRIAKIDLSGLDSRLRRCHFNVACDVNVPLLGPTGAARMFGPQKGATPAMVETLERNLAHWAEITGESCSTPGDGAAGGLGFALRALLNAQISSGAELVIEITDLVKKMDGADLVITGEGCSDEQTSTGKLCATVAMAARNINIPTILLSGALKGDFSDIFLAAWSIARGPCKLDEAIQNTAVNLEMAATNIGNMMKL